MKKSIMALALATAAAFTTINAQAADKLTFGTGNSPMHPMAKKITGPWGKKVNAEANGAVKIKVRHGSMLVNASNYLDRLADDVVQITWGVLGFKPGRFPKSLIATVPFIDSNAEEGALAFCRMYENGDFGTEFDGYKPLFFVRFPQTSIHMNGAPITKLSDMEGKKIMAGSPIAASVVEAYGGTPLSVVLPDQYQALQKGAADGNIMTFTAFPGFNLHEVTTDHLKLPFGGGIGMVFMTSDRYEGLSAESKAVIDANSGCEQTRKVGQIVDQWEADSLRFVEKAGGHTFNTIAEDDLKTAVDNHFDTAKAAYAARIEGGDVIIEKWIQAVADAKAEIAAK